MEIRSINELGIWKKKWADKEIAMMPSASQQNGILLSREVILLSNTQRGSVMDS